MVDEGPLGRVDYLILRICAKRYTSSDGFNRINSIPSYRLKALHHIAVGLEQLHQIQAAHQDVKPSSNVLVFPQSEFKLGDLGTASVKSTSSPHDVDRCPGTRAYAAPELLYRGELPDWNQRVFADLYTFGSMIVFLFSGLTAAGSLKSHLAPEFHPEKWTGSYFGCTTLSSSGKRRKSLGVPIPY